MPLDKAASRSIVERPRGGQRKNGRSIAVSRPRDGSRRQSGAQAHRSVSRDALVLGRDRGRHGFRVGTVAGRPPGGSRRGGSQAPIGRAARGGGGSRCFRASGGAEPLSRGLLGRCRGVVRHDDEHRRCRGGERGGRGQAARVRILEPRHGWLQGERPRAGSRQPHDVADASPRNPGDQPRRERGATRLCGRQADG